MYVYICIYYQHALSLFYPYAKNVKNQFPLTQRGMYVYPHATTCKTIEFHLIHHRPSCRNYSHRKLRNCYKDSQNIWRRKHATREIRVNKTYRQK